MKSSHQKTKQYSQTINRETFTPPNHKQKGNQPTKQNKHNQTEVKWIRKKSQFYCDLKSETYRAFLKLLYGEKIDLKPEEYINFDFEMSSDLASCTRINTVLSNILPPENLNVVVVGDCDGSTTIPCLLQLVPEKCSVVVRQTEKKHQFLANNINSILSRNTQNNDKCQYFASYDEYMKNWKHSGVSLHNSHPWDFVENYSKKEDNRKIDALIYQPVWNKKHEQILANFEKKSTQNAQKQKYEWLDDRDIENDLAFFQYETSAKEAIVYLDEFILDHLMSKNIECEVIVIKLRPEITQSILNSLEKSTLKDKYEVIGNVMELPNQRDHEIKYDSMKKSYYIVLENGNRQPLDPNDGQRGAFFHTLLRLKNTKNKKPTPILKYERPHWYKFLVCSDAQRQKAYVEKKKCVIPFVRIKSDPIMKVNVILESDFKETNGWQEKFLEIQSLRRTIEVQIEDLTFLWKTFNNFLEKIKNHQANDKTENEEMKEYIGQASYIYKRNFNVWYQSMDTDNQDRKNYGNKLIKEKTRLYTGVKAMMKRILEMKKWKLEPVRKFSPAFHAIFDSEWMFNPEKPRSSKQRFQKKKQIQQQLNGDLSLQDLSLYTNKDYFCGNLKDSPCREEDDGDPNNPQRGKKKPKIGNRAHVDKNGIIIYDAQTYGMDRNGNIHNRHQIDNEGVHNGQSSVRGNRAPNQQSSDADKNFENSVRGNKIRKHG